MISDLFYYIKLFIVFLPFLIFLFINSKVNMKKQNRHKQYVMPIVAFVYFIIFSALLNKGYELCVLFGDFLNNIFAELGANSFLNSIKDFFVGLGGYIALILFNTVALIVFIIIKSSVLAIFRKDIEKDSIIGQFIGLFYEFDEVDNCWYLKKNCSQMRTFVKVAYYAGAVLAVVILVTSYEFFRRELLTAPFCPVLAILFMGEFYFFIDGYLKEEGKGTLIMSSDNSKHVVMYALLRKPLKKLFEDKLASEGTTINMSGQSGGAAEEILASIENEGGHIGRNYANYIRKKIDGGLVPNVDYLRTGYDLATEKSLLFNTPFYDKLIPYVFYAANRSLLSGNKILVVMGRHGTESDLYNWCQKGMTAVTNVPDLYKISVLSGEIAENDEMPEIGIISRSGVHDLNIHKANMKFLKEVGFVIIIEPSRLVTTAQIGLNLLVKCFSEEQNVTFCSVDRNCDGLVDSLSHILMTNITEVSATEYPLGMSSYMCWKADEDYLQHRLFPGVSRYLGLGTELSFVALKNQVKQAVWYGGDVFPVLDVHWIAKQYYYDFLKYAQLPATQENFDQYFKTSFNMCNQCVDDYSYVTVEDDRNNLFEARRNFATIAKQQGFVNVISSEYMLREYMSENSAIFTADPKAIPYITADYARTKRNSVLSLCLLLCVSNVTEKDLKRRLMIMGIERDDYESALWKEICLLFTSGDNSKIDKNGDAIIEIVDKADGKAIEFQKSTTLIFKREYSVESGKFENIYTIENKAFAEIILDDLQNAGYIAERESKDNYIGTELKGHIYQKYLPGQFFTLNGKYYEMISAIAGNKIMVRRASEHINGRLMYRQLRKYTIDKLKNAEEMGTLKTINNIDIHYLFADFSVKTDGYWELKAYNDFKNGSLVEINAVPERKYYNKQILKLDFSKFGDLFTPDIRKTLTVLLNEVFVTLFAENQPFISAVTTGECEIPLTYSLEINDGENTFDNSIFIIEDSQLDIGLLVAVERNINRIMQIISDYLLWNDEKIEESLNPKREEVVITKENEELEETEKIEEVILGEKPKKKGSKFGQWIKSIFKKSKKKEKPIEEPEENIPEETTETEIPEETAEITVPEEITKIQEENEVADESAEEQTEIDENTDEADNESEVIYSE